MINSINISFSVQKIAVLTIVFSTFCFFSAFAQGDERSRNMPEQRVDDNFGATESPEANIIEYSARPSGTSTTNKATTTTPSKNRDIYKQTGEKDVRKENVSTLSFNLFLYIVDKFKED
jgi:hypothetical protein